jgi:uncharacterized protein YjlB
MLQDARHAIEKLTGFARPSGSDVAALVRSRKPQAFRFRDDGETPNNPEWPLVLYRSPVRLRDGFDPAAIFEILFAGNGWAGSWRNGMYDFLHFHTRTHEVLGIARGLLSAEFGGAAGRAIELKAGDVVVLPAGTGHRRLAASRDLLVVGAYPANSGEYDEPRPTQIGHEDAVRRIGRVKRPRTDPVFGKEGPLCAIWR